MLAIRKWVRKHKEASTSIWSADWFYTLLTHGVADYWVIIKKNPNICYP